MKKLLIGLAFSGLSVFSQNDLKQQWSFAEGLYKRGFYEDAMQEYQGLLTDSGNTLEKNALLRIITCCEQTKQDPEEYIDRYIKAESDPNLRVVVQLKKAALLIKKKEFTKAEQIYKTIISTKTDYLEHTLYEYGRLLLEQGKNQEAIDTFLDLSNKGKAEEKEVRIYAHYALASLYLGQENYSSAEKHLNSLTKMDKDHVLKTQAFILLIKLLATQERDNELISTYTELLQHPKPIPDLNPLTIQYALALIRQQKYDEARGAISSIKNPTPQEQPWVHYSSGICYYQLGFYKEAIQSFSQCLEASTFKQAPQASAYMIYSQIQLKDLNKSLELSKNFDKTYPNSSLRAEIHYKISLLALEQKNTPISISELQTALNTYLPAWDNSKIAHKLLAQTLTQEKRFSESAQIWQKLASQSTEDEKSEASFKAVENYLLAKEFNHAEEVLVRIIASPKHEFKKASLEIEIKISKKEWDYVHKTILLNLERFNKKEEQGLLIILQGRSYYLQNRLTEASTSLETATELILDTTLLGQSLNLLANIYQHQDLKAKAAKTYKVIFSKKLNHELDWSPQKKKEICRLLELENHLETSLIACESIPEDAIFYSLQKARIYIRLENYEFCEKNLVNIPLDQLDEKDLCAYSSIETLLLIHKGKMDKANRTLETIKRTNQWHAGDFTLYLYSRALYHYIYGEYDLCWKSANRAYILFNDSQFSSGSLFLAIQSTSKLNRSDDAQKLLKELKKRFPSYTKRPNVANFISKNLAKQ
jgi:TolA-binding protein